MTQQTQTSRMSDEAVAAKTGKAWEEWFAILDAAGGAGLDHKGIVAILEANFTIGGWWNQMVTVAYEQARGKRALHEMPDGYQVSASKTIAAPVARLYEAWVDEPVRMRWLPDAPLTLRTVTANKTVRAGWGEENTTVSVAFYPKGDSRCQVTVQHSRLRTEEEAGKMKQYWRDQLGKLQRLVEDE